LAFACGAGCGLTELAWLAAASTGKDDLSAAFVSIPSAKSVHY